MKTLIAILTAILSVIFGWLLSAAFLMLAFMVLRNHFPMLPIFNFWEFVILRMGLGAIGAAFSPSIKKNDKD